MRSTFFGIEVAKLALWAGQRGMDVTAHNVANADTPGYARQSVRQSAGAPINAPLFGGSAAGQIGSGVIVRSIESSRDAFVDRQVWSSHSEMAYWTLRRQTMDRVEVLLNEPGDHGLGGAMDRWWDALAVLVANPESMEARMQVLARANTMVETFQDLDRHLAALADDLRADVQHRVTAVNMLAERIAALNDRIVRAESGGQRANDLRDQRALLVEQLSSHVSVTTTETARGVLRVSIGGTDLVGEHGVRQLGVGVDAGEVTVEWVDSQRAVAFTGGAVRAALELLGDGPGTIGQMRTDLFAMAQTLSDEVNALHQNGYTYKGETDKQFFAFNDASLAGWRVDITEPEDIAAAGSRIVVDPGDPPTYLPVPGDGEVARAISQLKHKRMFADENFTLDDFYRSWVAGIGIAAQEAQRMEDNQALLVAQITNHREQLTGVSLDEELANLLQYERAYQAAARIMTAADEMLATLIHNTGVVGR